MKKSEAFEMLSWFYGRQSKFNLLGKVVMSPIVLIFLSMYFAFEWLFTRRPASEPKTRPEVDYVISTDGKSITCNWCGLTSHHPDDVKYHYCSNCQAFHGLR